jgi:hypothetical protein
MLDISFEVGAVGIARDTTTPTLLFDLRLTAKVPVEMVLLRCQVRIESPRRRYSPDEMERLRDLFGHPHQWSQTLRPLLWSDVSATVPPFRGNAIFPLSVPCAFDLNAGSCKYFHSLDGGEVPLTLMFSGRVFYRLEEGELQVAPISWDKEARTTFAIRTWREMMSLHDTAAKQLETV